jgi:hypothetical protein
MSSPLVETDVPTNSLATTGERLNHSGSGHERGEEDFLATINV